MSVYQIISKSFDKVYVGSTTETLSRRLSRHMEKYRNHYGNGSVNQVLKHGDCSINLIEKQPLEQLKQREGYWIRELNSVNIRIDGRTKRQYYLDNRDKIIAQKSRPFTCGCGSTVHIGGKSTHFLSKKHLQHVN